jgi:hypothetical protein
VTIWLPALKSWSTLTWMLLSPVLLTLTAPMKQPLACG